MPEVNEYDPGYVSWAELASPDPEAAKDFYCRLFGWYAYTLTSDDFGEYEIFTFGGVNGPAVAGMHGLADDTQRQTWSVYFRTDDVSATLDAVRAAGGNELLEPTDIANLGRLALCADTQGAEFSLWYPYTFTSSVVDEPNAMCWAELACMDIHEARRFYGEVFGWKAVDRHFYSKPYTHWKVGDWAVAGMVPLDELWPPDHPAHWTPYFWVDDCDAFTARATEFGARVRIPPTDIEPGRFCIMNDPAGARLAVITPRSTDLVAAKTAP